MNQNLHSSSIVGGAIVSDGFILFSWKVTTPTN